jgi:hypothetical protein
MLQQESHIKQWHLHQEHKLVVVPSNEPEFRTITMFRGSDGSLRVRSLLENHLREFVE